MIQNIPTRQILVCCSWKRKMHSNKVCRELSLKIFLTNFWIVEETILSVMWKGVNPAYGVAGGAACPCSTVPASPLRRARTLRPGQPLPSCGNVTVCVGGKKSHSSRPFLHYTQNSTFTYTTLCRISSMAMQKLTHTHTAIDREAASSHTEAFEGASRFSSGAFPPVPVK